MKPPHPRFAAVCFDCDSTLTRIEGIDELARRAGCEVEIAALTEAAMTGVIPLEAVYAKRLDMVRPGRADLAWLAERYAEEAVSGAAETVTTLRQHGAAVHIVTSGLLQAVVEFARVLGLAPAQVHAVEVNFDTTGAYCGFDADSPLCRGDGKAIVCKGIAAATRGPIAMVGDGITDLTARAGGAYIVGWGGVVERDFLRQQADCYIAGRSLTATLPILLSHPDPC
jgi:phosphoserine phosphatase